MSPRTKTGGPRAPRPLARDRAAAKVGARAAAARFPIVGVGASAGGLEAFKELLQPLPAKPGIAFVLIQHLDPTHASLLGPALAQSSKMPVTEARDGERVEPDHVYVMPSNATLTIRRGVLKLSPRASSPRPNMPIDIFFRALAEDARAHAIGVVLSGTAHDGTLGLESIKAEGGTTIAQSPETAKFDGMPRSAIDAGAADSVLAPAQIGAELEALRARTPVTLRALASARTETALSALFSLLRGATRVDFSGYKRATIVRRIARRLAVHKLSHVDDYLAYVATHPDELRKLHDDLLIHVTEFFRDPEVFEALATHVLPALLDGKAAGAPIRIWVPGCSTGEEVYSLAIVLSELLSKRKAQNPVQIFGSDVSEPAITRARAGSYEASTLREIGEKRLHRFFSKQDGTYRVQKSLRDLCVFVRHDVTNDPPFSKLDVISCRNLLIYFDAALQKRTVPLLHYALNDPGYLLLGRSETLTPFGDLFSLVDKTNKIFVRRPGAVRALTFGGGSSPSLGPIAPFSRPQERGLRVPDLEREVEQALLARYAPPGVVVSEDLQILHFRGRTGHYLEPAPGQANLHLLRMAREGLLHPLRDVLAEAKRTRAAARREGVLSKHDSRTRAVNIEVLPMRTGPAEQRCYLVLFEDAPAPPAAPARKGKRARDAASVDVFEKSLQRELAETKSFLQSVVEQHEETNDELTSANEELLSGNEELQSTNEEMNTAKEELQSTNEELTTVNDELQNRNRELSRLNDDLVNLLASVDIAIVILDRERKIRRFTPKSRAVMNLIPTDVGRPIGDINPTVEVPLLDQLITESLDTLSMKEVEVIDHAGHWFRLQIRPYRTSEDVIDGAVVSLVDIDVLKRTAADALAARDFAARMAETVPIPTLLLDGELNVKSANAAFYVTFGLIPEKTVGRPIQGLTEGGWLPALMKEPLAEALATGSAFELVEVEHEVPRLGKRTMMLTGRVIGDGAPLVLIAIQDVTEVKRAEEARLRVASLEQASREKDVFLAMLSHELRTPLNSILLWSQVLGQDRTIPPKSLRAVQGIEQSARAQSQLVDDLLDVSRIISGKLQISPVDVDLGPLVQSAVDAFQAEAGAKRITLEVTIDPAPSHVLGDSKRLRQVVWNLVSNAIKFTPSSGHVEVRLARTDGRVRLQVEDDGVGIDPAFLPRVFERFAQQDSTTTRAHGGLGLGLGLARYIVELHGGTICAENNPGAKGVTLTVELPVVVEALRTAPEPKPAVRASNVNLEGLRVLVIDDESECRAVLPEVLGERGAEVHVVESAQQARDALESFTPDVIVCDVGMPIEDGIQFMKRLRAQPSERGGAVPAAALTAYADEETRKGALEAGFQLHLTKPIDIDALLSAVARLGEKAARPGPRG
jgi:two-component system, chemotaxis family, CheB/CheR fusion protein